MDSVRKARLEQEHRNWDSTRVKRKKAAKLDRQLVRQLKDLFNHVQKSFRKFVVAAKNRDLTSLDLTL